MKKIFLLILMLLIIPTSVSASNKINSININVNILENGTAQITEVWDVDGEDGTEWYKVMNNLGNSKLSNFTVSMDGTKLKYKHWNINESLSQKKGYYGINNTSSGLELCFGKYDYNRHKFTLNYTLSNFIFNTEDSQVLYFNFIDKLSDVNFDNFSITIQGYYYFPDTLDVWGYGYKGYAYVEDGKIKLSNESDMDNKYVVLLAKFPSNTFNTTNSYSQFNTFNDVYTKAEEGTVDYEDDELINVMHRILCYVLVFAVSIILEFLAIRAVQEKKYGYKNNKTINKNDVPFFRDIPCNKDIYYANTLIKLNDFGYKESNILGAIILKWVKENKIAFKNEITGIFNKETSVIDLTMNPTFDNELETKLFQMMHEASKDGKLETKEFEKWSRKNYSNFLSLFKRIENQTIDKLKSDGLIYKRADKSECKNKNVMNDTLYEDSVKLYGLKKYLLEFSKIDTKEVMEVHLWDEYLMFAYLFGIADKVAKQLKNMYPEIIEQENFNYDTIIFVNNISIRSVSAATNARNAAQSYSGGGGGFSSGGGGGGSFGGGGGGSR